MRVLGMKLKDNGFDFNAKEQWSQYVLLLAVLDSRWLMLNSCFSHAIAIAEGKFLSRLTLPSKKSSLVNTLSSEEVLPGEVDPDIDDEDIEEEIEKLAKTAVINLQVPDNNSIHWQSKLAAQLLLKVRGFIAKVCPHLHFADWSCQ
jgi:hypothetical protein